jgi:methylglutaconyl-CoA hydratase
MSDVLEIERAGAVARVWLNRPDVRNAFNEDSIAALARTFADLARDDGLRVVVLGGRGKAFCAGADLGWMRKMAGYTWEQNRADAQALAEMLWTIYSCPMPVVGASTGLLRRRRRPRGGLRRAVAADAATFCLSEAPRAVAGDDRAVRDPGARRTGIAALLRDRRALGAEQARARLRARGAADALDAKVDELVGPLVANGPMATRACKKLVQDVAGLPITPELRAETARRIADIRASDEGREGIQSFLQKRKPAWLLDA